MTNWRETDRWEEKRKDKVEKEKSIGTHPKVIDKVHGHVETTIRPTL